MTAVWPGLMDSIFAKLTTRLKRTGYGCSKNVK